MTEVRIPGWPPAGATCTYQPTTAAVVAAEAAGGRQGALLRRWAPVELNRIDTQHDGHRPWGEVLSGTGMAHGCRSCDTGFRVVVFQLATNNV